MPYAKGLGKKNFVPFNPPRRRAIKHGIYKALSINNRLQYEYYDINNIQLLTITYY